MVGLYGFGAARIVQCSGCTDWGLCGLYGVRVARIYTSTVCTVVEMPSSQFPDLAILLPILLDDIGGKSMSLKEIISC